MKKILTICLVLSLALCLCASVVASANGFVISPSGRPAPGVVEFEPGNSDCTAELVITPYGERETLPEHEKAMIEKAFTDIVNSDDLTELNADLDELAGQKNIDGEHLAVSELFDIHVAGCEDHEGHVDFDIILDAETLSHFVALMYLNDEGEWVLVEDAEVVNNGEHLKFSAEEFSPFVIVVDTSKNSPTGDDNMIFICMALMLVSGVAVVLINRKPRAV